MPTKEKRKTLNTAVRQKGKYAMQKYQGLSEIFSDASRFSSFTTSAYTCVVLTLL